MPSAPSSNLNSVLPMTHLIRVVGKASWSGRTTGNDWRMIRFDWEGFEVRMVLTNEACDPGDRPTRADTCYDGVDVVAAVFPDFRACRCFMNRRVRGLAGSGLDPNALVPGFRTAAHIRRPRVADARDCGASFIITKPFSATTLLERIVWVARDGRPFLEVGDYFGPDRRFRTTPAPPVERRADLIRKKEFEDRKAETAAAGEAS